jgi:hypothetical protein
VDRQALVTALFGFVVGVVGCYFLVRRAWWPTAGWMAIGAAALLNLITEGSRPPGENLARFAATGTLLVIFALAAIIHWRRARSVPDGLEATGQPGSTAGDQNRA